MSTSEGDASALADMVDAALIDDRSPDAPSRASLAGCDTARARAELVARMRRGEMSLRERAAALMLAGQVGMSGREEELASIVADGALPLSSRSCALSTLLALPEAGPRLQPLARRLGDRMWTALLDEKLTLELLLRMPAPDLADALAMSLARAPRAAVAEAFARVERCRRAAGLPALLAWRKALALAELASVHDAMIAAIADESGEGASLVLEMLWGAAPDDGYRARLGRIVARIEARSLRGVTREAVGGTHRVQSSDDGAQWMVCIAHPGRMTLVAQAWESAAGGLRVDGVFVLPAEPSVQISGGDGVVTLSYRVMPLAETRDLAMAAAKAMRAEGQNLPHELCLTLCLLDGLPQPEPPMPAQPLD